MSTTTKHRKRGLPYTAKEVEHFLTMRERREASETRYFASVAGFSDDTAYIRVEKTGGVWDGTTVLKDGSEKLAGKRGIAWCLKYVQDGAWREVNQSEAQAHLQPEAR